MTTREKRRSARRHARHLAKHAAAVHRHELRRAKRRAAKAAEKFAERPVAFHGKSKMRSLFEQATDFLFPAMLRNVFGGAPKEEPKG